jgi:DNA polymerase I-like protein with 3'-5' exonuclease and polymerase domains
MNIVTTPEQLEEVVKHYLTVDAFAFDVETVGDRRGVTVINEVLWISLATHGRCDVIPMGHPNGEFIEETYPLTGQGQKRKDQGLTVRPSDYSRDKKKSIKLFSAPPEQLFPAEVFIALKPLFFKEDILKVGHNLIFDLTSIAKYLGGRFPIKPYFDTLIASFLIDNRNRNKLGLDDCLKRELGYEMEKGVGKEVEKYSFEEVAKYAYLDAKYTFLLYKSLKPRLTQDSLEKVMNLEMDVLEVLCAMKLSGADIDKSALIELKDALEEDLENTKGEIFKIAGRHFNINSTKEKKELLYLPVAEGGRGLRVQVLTTKGLEKSKDGNNLGINDYSASAEALEHYRNKDPLVTEMLRYSDLNKLLTTYVVPYLGGDVVRTTNGKARVEKKESLLINDKIHCDFVQQGAETGRFSSRNPNLQNVPAPHTPHGKAIRNLFIAPKGHKLVVADYSQIEPRIIASMSEDPIMVDSYVQGKDLYTTVGDTMGVDRKAGKVLVLSMAYGVGPDKIAKQIGCSLREAKDLLDNFSHQFNSVNKYRLKLIGAAKLKSVPYVTTLFGRRRYLPDLTSKLSNLKASAERQAFNTRIQGSAADIIKFAMVRAYHLIPERARIILTVHDELVTVTPDSLVSETTEAIKEAMEGINVLSIPLIADINVVQRWGEAK